MTGFQSVAWFLDRWRTAGADHVRWLEQVFFPDFVRAARARNVLRFSDAADFSYSLDCLRQHGHATPPLAGLPLAHKEIIHRKGWLAEAGSPTRRGVTATDTAPVLQQLDRAGALNMGQLVSAEFALSPTGHNPYTGTPGNPWNPAHIPGGSSSGSAVAVASGLVPVSLGTDTAGSVRLPAAACGLAGLKPTYGLLSNSGVFPLAPSLDTVGLVARSIKDIRPVFQTLTAGAAGLPKKTDSVPTARQIKIGLLRPYFFDACAQDILSPIEETLTRFQATFPAVQIKDDVLAGAEQLNQLLGVILGWEAARLYGHIVKDNNKLGIQAAVRLREGLQVKEADYQAALTARDGILANVLSTLFEHHDILITPVWNFPIPTLAQTDCDQNPENSSMVLSFLRQAGRNVRPFSYLGLPALTLPIARDTQGLPISIQLVGRPFADFDLLSFAEHIEQMVCFWDQKPGG